ncbi:MAG: DUF4652 domain-containing protein [Clostridiales bacterium]|nr:DUF4652 domain-containing protein [Clostridiales bacterium]
MKTKVYLLIIIILLTGCMKTIEHLDTKLDIQYKTVLIDKSELIYRSNDSGGIRLISYIKNNKEKLINDNGPSEPVINSSKDKVAFIDNYYWEATGDVWVYDVNKEKSEIIIKSATGDQQKPKSLTWYDDNKLLVVIGYAYGTVSVGGDLYIYDFDSEELSLIIMTDINTEIIDAEMVSDGVKVNYAKFNENMTEYEVESEIISIE